MLQLAATCLLVLALVAPTKVPGVYHGTAVRIADGDTFTLLTAEKREIRVRLWGIDAPEKKQAFGQRSKQMLARLITEQALSVRVHGVDRYGRVIGEVFLDDSSNVNEAMVRAGMAWWYQTYAPKAVRLDSLQQAARARKIGLWSDREPVPPWVFRRPGATASAPAPQPHTHTHSDAAANDTATVILNTASRKYHCPSCKGARQCTKNCVPSTRRDAIGAGAKPCGMCGGTCN